MKNTQQSKLSELISANENVNDALIKLENQNKIDGSILSDDVITMVEELEYTLTVKELLNLLK